MNALIVAAAYVFTPVVIPGASSIAIFGINDKGQAVVQTDIRGGIYHQGTFTPLPSPPAGFEVSAFGINNAGIVVGNIVPGADGREEDSFILTGSGYKTFFRLGWPRTEARAIGNSGLITGVSFFLSPVGSYDPSAGFVYDPNANVFTDVKPSGSEGINVFAHGINKSGVISGSATDSINGEYAFIWQMGTFTNGKRGVVSFLDRFLINGRARARGINDAGLLTGFADDETGSTNVGVVGNSVRGYRLLTLPGATADNGGTICEGINNLAQVTCFFSDAAGNGHAFIGSPEVQDGD